MGSLRAGMAGALMVVCAAVAVTALGYARGRDRVHVPDPRPAPPSVHRRVVTAKIRGFDPARAGDAFSGEAAYQICEPLYEFHYLKRNPFELLPLTAAGPPEMGADGRTWTIRIRPGIRFHDDPCFPGGTGRELVAGDFLYAWKRVADPATESSMFAFLQGLIEGIDEWREAALAAEQADYDRPVPGLRAPDADTLEIRLTRPHPRFPHLLALPFMAAVPREAVERYGKGFDDHPVGTGAYRLAEWVRDSRYVLERHPGYRDVRYPAEGEPPHGAFPGDAALGRLADAGVRVPICERIEVSIIEEESPRWLEFLSGALDCVEIPRDAWGQALSGGAPSAEIAARGIRLEHTALLDLTYHCFNLDDPLFGPNRKLREAIACAVDCDLQRRILLNGQGVVAESLVPPGLAGYDDAWRNPRQRFDLERARALLAEAGYPGGEGLPEIPYEVQTAATSQRQRAELLKEMLARIGVRIRLEINTWPSFTKKVEEGRARFFGIGWGADYPDAENFLQLLYGPNIPPAGSNVARFRDAEYDRLYEEIVRLTDSPERTARIRRMIAIACENGPWVLGHHRDAWWLVHPWCHNYKYPVVGGGYWKYVRVDAAERAARLGR